MSELTWQAAAAANILEARKRNGRIGSRKSRSGCLTCKTRRIKCDETHPECRNCSSTGRKCYYVDALTPKPNNNKPSRSLIGQQLSKTLGLGESDIRTFDYFLSWTAPRLAGSLDKEFWCGQVLQVAQTEPIVLDALLAISILYEHPQYMKSFYPPGDPKKSADAKFQNGVINFTHPAISQPPIDEHHASALMHYNRAMRRFKERIDEGTATPLLALLTCALFICTEVIRDHVFGALVLFTQGTKLLSEYEPSGPTDTALYMNLRLMFARFGLHTSLFGHSGRVDIPVEFIEVDTENGFASILNARSSLYALTTDVQDCIRDTASYRLGPRAHLPRTNFIDDFPSEESYPGGPRKSPDGVTRLFYGCVDEETVAAPLQKARIQQPTAQVALTAQPPPWYQPPAEMLGRQALLRERLGEWYTAFMKSPFDKVDDEASVNLIMHHLIFHVWLEVCLIPSESAFDQFTPQFKEILRLADIFLKLKTERTTFTLEAGVIPHLYFVATKCRVPSLRRRAVDLMHKAPFKEAMHGATSVAEFVNVMIAIEEEDLYSYPTPPGSVRTATQSPPIDDSVLPPEHKRIQILEILKNKPAGRFEIRVSRHSYDATGQRIKVVKDYPM